MECKHCHTALAEGSLYCHICGKKQSGKSKQRRHRPKAQGTITKLSGKRTNPYWARLPADYCSGVPERKSLGCYPTYAAASEAIAKALYTEPNIQDPSTQSITLQQIYDRFINSNYYTSLGQSAQSSHRAAWKHLAACWQIPMTQVNKDTFQVPIGIMQEKGLKRETIAKVRNLASLLCKEAMGLGLISVNFGQLIQLPQHDTVPAKPFSSSDLKRIWHASDSGNKDAKSVLILVYTGMRPNELLSLEISEHLHIHGEYWYINTGSKTSAGRNRLIPIPDILHDIIDFCIDGRKAGPLIAAEKGGYHRVDTWRARHFHPLMAELELTGFAPYSCRHTFADIQKRRHVDPELQMRIMGHSDYSTTVERYQTTTDEDIARICSAVSGLERPK